MIPEIEEMLKGNFIRPEDLNPPKFNPLTLEQLLAMPPKEWLIDQLLGAGDLAMIYGSPGSGKTFVVVDLIFPACLGQKFAMRFNVTRPLNVAYCAGEGVSGLPARFAAAAEHYGVESLSNFTFYAVTPSLFYEDRMKDEIESIERFVLEWKQRQAKGEAQPLDILFIDTLHSATAGADENSAQDMGVVLGLCKKATRALGCAVVLVHHSNKAGTGERGSSAMRGAMDCMIEVHTAASKYAISCEKLKDGERWKEQTFDLVAMGDSVRVWWDEPTTPDQEDKRKSETAREILDILAQKLDRSLTARQIADGIGQTPQAVNRVINRLVKDEFIKRDENNRNTFIYSITAQGMESLEQSFTTNTRL
jgi:predicted transcriptional regulator